MAHFVILDDDETFGRMLSRGLRSHEISSEHYSEFSALVAGRAACAAETPEPDVYVVDLSMPDPNGVHWEFGGILALKQLRESVGEAAMIWVLTGYEDPRIERECCRNGANFVLFKSFGVAETAEDLALAWRDTAQKQKQRREAQSDIERGGAAPLF
ncbi:MAG: response regulator [Pseudomonadota bacterium]